MHVIRVAFACVRTRGWASLSPKSLLFAPPHSHVPFKGMDPIARRFMWDIISRMTTKDRECSVILTTHSMEEAESLCNKIGMMVRFSRNITTGSKICGMARMKHCVGLRKGQTKFYFIGRETLTAELGVLQACPVFVRSKARRNATELRRYCVHSIFAVHEATRSIFAYLSLARLWSFSLLTLSTCVRSLRIALTGFCSDMELRLLLSPVSEALSCHNGLNQVNGRLRCLGSTQHLKHRFGRGFEADMKLHRPSDEAATEVLRVMQEKRLGPIIGQGLDR